MPGPELLRARFQFVRGTYVTEQPPRQNVGLPAGFGMALGVLGRVAFGSTNLQETSGLVWTMVAIGAAGSIVTFAFLVYSILKFRDPATRRRRYG